MIFSNKIFTLFQVSRNVIFLLGIRVGESRKDFSGPRPLKLKFRIFAFFIRQTQIYPKIPKFSNFVKFAEGNYEAPGEV